MRILWWWLYILNISGQIQTFTQFGYFSVTPYKWRIISIYTCVCVCKHIIILLGIFLPPHWMMMNINYTEMAYHLNGTSHVSCTAMTSKTPYHICDTWMGPVMLQVKIIYKLFRYFIGWVGDNQDTHTYKSWYLDQDLSYRPITY